MYNRFILLTCRLRAGPRLRGNLIIATGRKDKRRKLAKGGGASDGGCLGASEQNAEQLCSRGTRNTKGRGVQCLSYDGTQDRLVKSRSVTGNRPVERNVAI